VVCSLLFDGCIAFALTLDQTGVETYGTIFTIAPSHQDVNTIWTGSDDGLVHITRNGGKNWANIPPATCQPDTGILVRMNARATGPARRLLEVVLAGPHKLVLSEFLTC
jgi:hypothetical protein